MAQPAIAPIPVNGTVLSQREVHEVAEYEKILRLRDEIFTGKHPRLKVPSHAIVKATAKQVESPPGPPTSASTQASRSNVLSNGVSAKTKESTPVISQPVSQAVPQPCPFLHKPLSNQRHTAVTPSSSGIDPIFLTKSDDLVRAEIQLQRQRLERALKESVDRLHKAEARGRSDQEPLPDFDVSEVLAKALQMVPPLAVPAIDGANGMSVATDSFDENSYYSSQVNDSPMDDSNNDPEVIERLSIGNDGAMSGPHDSNGTSGFSGLRDVKDHEVASKDVDDFNVPSYTSPQHQSPSTHKSGMPEKLAENRVLREESEYSPPAADYYASQETGYGEGSKAQPNEHRQPLNLHAGDFRSRPSPSITKPIPPPSPEVRVVRNHIASPVAPQPSRVSPLAVAKLPPFARERRDVEEPPVAPEVEMQTHSARQSPEEAPQPSGHRKRRKKGDGADRPRKHRKGKIADSPEPYIKEEPQSPPLFASQPRLRRREPLRQAQRPIEIPDTSPRGYRSDPRYLPEYEDRPPVYRYEVETPPSTAIERTSSRLDRRDPDLRRIASLQYTKRVVSPPQYSADFFPRAPRSVSHTYTERPVVEHSQYPREPVRSYAGHYSRSEQSRSPPPLRERLSPAIMGPPPRKIVVDQYGNRYYAAPPTIDLTSSVPPPTRDENINPRYAPIPVRDVRDHVRRAPVGPVELYDDEGVDERMAPPVARRVVERADVDMLDQRTYRHQDYEPRPMETMIPQEDRGQRHQLRHGSYVSQVEPIPLPPREYVPRLHSVRPEAGRYEASREYVSRVQSVRPESEYAPNGPTRSEAPPRAHRELKLRPDDVPRVREYLPVNNERFTYAPRPQSRGYLGTNLTEWPRERIQEIHEPESRRPSYRY